MHHEMTAYGCSATVVVLFPLAARIADVRRAASLLTIKRITDEAATNRWIRVTDRLARDLANCGFDPIVIAMELCDFEDAVDEEIARRSA